MNGVEWHDANFGTNGPVAHTCGRCGEVNSSFEADYECDGCGTYQRIPVEEWPESYLSVYIAYPSSGQ